MLSIVRNPQTSVLLLFLLFGPALWPCQSVFLTSFFDEAKPPSVNPNDVDVLLLDLPVATMRLKTLHVFGYTYNSPTTIPANFPIHGVILKDSHERIVFPLVVSYKKKKIQTSCLADTGSPYTYLSDETFRALGLEIKDNDNGFNLNIHGAPVTTYRSVNHFSDINMCGQSFFAEHKLLLTVNYRTRKAFAEKTADLTDAELQEL
jgi:hypothetical protein